MLLEQLRRPDAPVVAVTEKQIAVGLVESWIQPQGFLVEPGSVVKLAQRLVKAAEVVVGMGVARVERDRLAQGLFRLRHAAKGLQGHAEHAVSLEKIRRDADSFLEAGD